MTDLKRAVRRRTIGLHRGRKIMVSLEPGDLLGLRPERCRREELLDIAAAYCIAVKIRVLAERGKRK